MFIYNADKTVTIKCSDGEYRTFVLSDEELVEYIRTGEHDYINNIEVF
jgi:hypothetical protein